MPILRAVQLIRMDTLCMGPMHFAVWCQQQMTIYLFSHPGVSNNHNVIGLPAEEFKRLKMLICGGKGGGGMMKNMPKNLQKGMAGMNPHNMQMNMAQMSRMLPPHVLKQMGGPAALQGLMRQMEGK